MYADDAAYISSPVKGLQHTIDVMGGLYSAEGLLVNTTKTEIMCHRVTNTAPHNKILLNGEPLKEENKFFFIWHPSSQPIAELITKSRTGRG